MNEKAQLVEVKSLTVEEHRDNIINRFEISPVAIPMNEKAQLVEVKSLTVEEHRDNIINRFELLAKNLGDKQMRLQNEAELLKLAEEYKLVTQPAEATAPTEEDTTDATTKFLTELNEALKNN